jgi:hypothetical protein
MVRPLARVGMARAYALKGDTARSRIAYDAALTARRSYWSKRLCPILIRLMTLHGVVTSITGERSDRLFRILGYGGIAFLLGILLWAVYEPIKLSDATRTVLTWTVGAVVCIELIALTILYILPRAVQPRLRPPVSPLTRRWLRRVTLTSVISFGCFIGIVLGFGDGVVDLFWSFPFWLPGLFIFVYLRGSRPKTGLALAVAMGCTLFFAIAMARSVADDWSDGWRIHNSLTFAMLVPLILSATAIRTYYTMPRERGDLRQLLWSSTYGGIVLILLLEALPGVGGSPVSRHEIVAAARLRTINVTVSAYARKFGGIYPERLAALGPPSFGRKKDCGAAGLSDIPLDNRTNAYTFEYRSGVPAEKIATNCRGGKNYTVIARPIVFGESGTLSFFTDDSGIIRCTSDNRTPTVNDPRIYYLAHQWPTCVPEPYY